MAKRIIGVVAALAIIVIVIFTALGCGGYKSMLPDDLFSVKASVESAEVQQQTVQHTPEAEGDTQSAEGETAQVQ